MNPKTQIIRAYNKAKRLDGKLHSLRGAGYIIDIGGQLTPHDTLDAAEKDLDRRLALVKIAELERKLGKIK